MAYEQIIFNEGAPLDPQKLNDLQINVSTIVGDLTKIKNATIDQEYVMQTDGGYVITDALVANTISNIEVPYSPLFVGVPTIVASVGGPLNQKDVVTLSIKDADRKPMIQVQCNVNKPSGIRINWIAFEKK